jgi:hypothetical protein
MSALFLAEVSRRYATRGFFYVGIPALKHGTGIVQPLRGDLSSLPNT